MNEGNLGRKPHVQQIYLDMDGVLCDWLGGVCKLYGRDRDEFALASREGVDFREWLGVTNDALWAKVHEAGVDFWANLDTYPWAYDLWVLCNKTAKTKICSTPGRWPTTPDSLAGKQLWLQRELGCPGKTFRDTNFSFSKEDFAILPGIVLIDDRKAVIEPFVAKGGMAIQCPNDFEERWREVPNALSVVKAELSSLVKYGEVR